MIEINGSNTVSASDRKKKEALILAKDTVTKLNDIQNKLDSSQISQNEYLEKIHGFTQLWIKELSNAIQNASQTDLKPLSNSIDRSLLAFKDIFKEIQSSCKNIASSKSDVSQLSKLLNSNFKSITNALIENLDNSEVELKSKLETIIELLTKIKDKKSPMFIGGGGGGGTNIPLVTISDGTQAVPVKVKETLTPNVDFDYIDIQQTSATVETYVYKNGGSGGSTVQTITVTYTDGSKADLDKVEYS